MRKLIIYQNNQFRVTPVAIINIILLILINIPAYSNYSKQDPKYGNGQTSGFIDSMYGSSTNFTLKEMQQFHHSKFNHNNNKYFIRIGGISGSSYLSNLKNASTDPAMVDGILDINQKKFNKTFNGEIALGYKFNKFHNEIELFLPANIKYSSNILFNNKNFGFNTITNSKAIFWNGYYDVINFKSMSIFVGAGLGLGLHSTKANFYDKSLPNNLVYNTRNNFTVAYSVLMGCSLKIVSQFFVKTSIRYINLGGQFGKIKIMSTNNLTWQDNNIIIKGSRSLIGVSLSFTHIFM